MIENFFQSVEKRWPGMADAMKSEPSVSIRLNKQKQGKVPDSHDGIVPWCANAVYLAERPQFTLDPLMHQGVYYVQDASSMAVGTAAEYLAGLLKLRRPLIYLDACAAPGGKTTAAIDSLPPDSIVFANEFDFHRANILAENVAKWGSARTVLTRGDTARYSKLKHSFDIIAADAPCSGEGMIRKDPEAARQWSNRLIDECAERQREILSKLWPALRPGGFLIYSTCTFNDKENDHIVEWLEQEYGASRVALPLADIPGICDKGHIYRFLPSRVRGEGLCVAALRKPGEMTENGSESNSRHKAADKTPVPEWLKGALPDGFAFSLTDGTLMSMPSDMSAICQKLLKPLDIISHGIKCAVAKGKDWIPRQELAMASDLRSSAFTTVEIDHGQALQYLRREAPLLPDGTPVGYVLLLYRNRPLGFVKNIGRRCNNLYPQEWRIRNI